LKEKRRLCLVDDDAWEEREREREKPKEEEGRKTVNK
jgi:hypothetical protein